MLASGHAERELESREALTVAQQVLQELLDGVHSPDRPQSPVQCSADEELFHSLNPKLHYKHQTVQDLHQLWNFYITTPVPEEQKPVPNHVMWPLEPISSPEIIENTQRPPSEKEESSHGWTLSIKDLKQATDSIPEDAARELFLSHLNKDIIELSQPPQVAAVDLLHQTCLQLWREAMDELVERSLLLRSVLEMPDKDVSAEFVLEESAVDQKPIKGVKEEKKGGGPKEEKKALGGKDKEDKKGGKIGMKEENPGSRKGKGKEEKKLAKPMAVNRESKELVSSAENLDPPTPESSPCLVDRAVQEKYEERLYIEVYGILVSVVQDLVSIAEDLKPKIS